MAIQGTKRPSGGRREQHRLLDLKVLSLGVTSGPHRPVAASWKVEVSHPDCQLTGKVREREGVKTEIVAELKYIWGN